VVVVDASVTAGTRQTNAVVPVVVAGSVVSVVFMVSAIVVGEVELDDVSSIVVDLMDVSITVVVGDVGIVADVVEVKATAILDKEKCFYVKLTPSATNFPGIEQR
jgi:hypothetical protein